MWIVGWCRLWRVVGCGAIMPRSLLSVPLAYSDFWELAGGGGEPAGGRKRRKREERENVEGRWGSGRTNGGLEEEVWSGRMEFPWDREVERWTSLRPLLGMRGQGEEECRQRDQVYSLIRNLRGQGGRKWFPLLGESHKIRDQASHPRRPNFPPRLINQRVSPSKAETLVL